VDDADLIPISALQHFLYCPRQCALIHLEQQWAESRHTAEGRLLHGRTDQPKAERRKGIRTVTAMPLLHQELGITGIADVVEFHQVEDGEQVLPVEYNVAVPRRIVPTRCSYVLRVCAWRRCWGSRLHRGLCSMARLGDARMWFLTIHCAHSRIEPSPTPAP
jgi:CRISPR-associated exonuclease Cas4